MTPPCTACGSTVGVQRHHPSGRDGAGHYFHQRWTLALCAQCHRDVHLLIDRRRLDATPVGVLGRIASLLAVLTWPPRSPDTVTLQADFIAGLAQALDDVAASLPAPAEVLR